MIAKKIFDDHPRGTYGLRIVILSFVEEWLRVTMVRARINEYYAKSFCSLHGWPLTCRRKGRLQANGIRESRGAARIVSWPRRCRNNHERLRRQLWRPEVLQRRRGIHVHRPV